MHRPRWWPLIGIVVLWILAVARIRANEWRGSTPQALVLLIVTLVAVGLAVLWFLFFSRLPTRIRWTGLGILGLGAGLFFALFHIRGYTGDVIPIFGWRWSGVSSAGTGRLTAAAADYPQFLGPSRDGTVRGIRLARDWSAQPPRLVWRRPIGAGWAGFAVARGIAFTLEQAGDDERLTAYDLATGEPRWSHADAVRFASDLGGLGPRSTPAVADGTVCALGATGHLRCLDAASGKLLWQRDVVSEEGGHIPSWGKSCSPLVAAGRVVVSAGGAGGRSLVAYDLATGSPLWHGGDDASGYSSPLAAELAGRSQIVTFNAASVAAHDPATGEVLWSFPWPGGQPNVSMPLVLAGDRLFVSTGYGIGGTLLQVAAGADGRLAAHALWATPRLKAKFSNTVEHGGFLYGLDDGVLVCLDPATGERRWKEGRFGHGQLLLAGDLLLVQAEDGQVILIDPQPQAMKELGRFTALDGKIWNPPALAGPYLLVRNDREAALYELAVER